MSMYRVFSCGRGCLLWPVPSLGKTLLAFALLHSVLQGQICLLLQVFLDFLLLHSSPLKWKGHVFWVLVLEGLIGLHRTIQLSFFIIPGWGIDLDYCDFEWFALETNRDHSVVFEIASKSCILDYFVDYDGYSIFSKGFMPTLVDIMVIGVKFTHSSPFYFTDSLKCWCLLLPSPFDHFQSALIHEPNIPGPYAILLFTASDLTSITSHIHNWGLFLLWLHLFSLLGVISPLISSSILGTCWPGSSSFSVLQFCFFILFMAFSRQEYWNGLPFPFPVDHVLSELSTMTHPSWVNLHGMAHSSIELDKVVVYVIRLVSFLWS